MCLLYLQQKDYVTEKSNQSYWKSGEVLKHFLAD